MYMYMHEYVSLFHENRLPHYYHMTKEIMVMLLNITYMIKGYACELLVWAMPSVNIGGRGEMNMLCSHPTFVKVPPSPRKKGGEKNVLLLRSKVCDPPPQEKNDFVFTCGA